MLRSATTILRSSQRTFSSLSALRNEAQKQAELPQSSCKAGTPLNLKIKKNGPEPVALEDSEYPEWLWKVFDKEYQASKLENDPIKKAKREMRLRNKKKIKMNNFVAQMK
jgi:large subunit ribosomal protein L54